jgi:hypothetical protein
VRKRSFFKKRPATEPWVSSPPSIPQLFKKYFFNENMAERENRYQGVNERETEKHDTDVPALEVE